MFDVVVVGNAGIDTTVYLHDPIDLGRETDYTENLDGVGQSGGYAARGFARLGYRTALLGYVGDDALGRFLVDELAADGVDMGHVIIDPAGTNRSVNLLSPDGQRHSFFDGKSHMTAEPDVDAWSPVLDGLRLVHFSIPNWARRLLHAAREAGAVLSVDLQDLHDLDDPYRRDFVVAADVIFVSSVHLADPRRCARHIAPTRSTRRLRTRRPGMCRAQRRWLPRVRSGEPARAGRRHDRGRRCAGRRSAVGVRHRRAPDRRGRAPRPAGRPLVLLASQAAAS